MISWCNGVTLILMAMVTVGSAQFVAKNRPGEACTTAGKGGQWTDISECGAAAEFIQVAGRLEFTLEELDIIVCCELTRIRRGCNRERADFEFSRIDVSQVYSHPQVIVREVCDDSEEEQNREVADMTGCCEPDGISLSKCKQPGQYGVGDNCSESPFLAELFNEKKVTEVFCSGILISLNIVLTTGMCVFWNDPRFARIGTKNPTDFIAVEKEIIHPAYATYFTNDIGLLRLAEAVILSLNVRPACLPPRQAVERAVHNMVGIEDKISTVVRTNATVTDLQHCKGDKTDDEHNFCVVRSEPVPCQVKWGAGAIEPSDDSNCTTIVTAILSHNPVCQYMLFTRLAPHLYFIEQTILSN